MLYIAFSPRAKASSWTSITALEKNEYKASTPQYQQNSPNDALWMLSLAPVGLDHANILDEVLEFC
jgi:hypothetical protein